MEENLVLPLEDFLKEYGIDVVVEELTNKEKLEMVKNIFIKLKSDRDWVDYRYSQKTKEEKTEETINEYVYKINNLDIRIMYATYHSIVLKSRIKEERKLKRKKSFQKVLNIFKNNKTE